MFVLTAVGYTTDTLYFNPLSAPVEVDEDIVFRDMELVSTGTRDCTLNFTSGTEDLSDLLLTRTGA